MIHRQRNTDIKSADACSGKPDEAPFLDPFKSKSKTTDNCQDVQTEPDHFNPLVAELWADLIIHHLRVCRASGELDLSSPVDILDLVPGFGQSSWLMAQALLRKASEIENLHIRYIPVAPEKNWFASICNTPEFTPLLMNQSLVPMLWDFQGNEPYLLLQSDTQLWHTANPCVVLAHNKWANLQQRLFAVHYGKLLEANLDYLKTTIEPEQRCHQWKNVEAGSLNANFDSLIDHYLTHFNSSPIPYPENALKLLDKIIKKLPDKYLMLTAAGGFASERSLRLSSFTKLIDSFEKDKRFPVNFHFISHYFEQLGTYTQEVEMQKGIVLQIAMHGHIDGKSRVTSLAQKLDAGMFHHASALIDAMHSLGVSAALDSRLALLKLSQYDPEVFMASHAALIKSFTKSPDFDRIIWCEALARVWKNHLPTAYATKLYACLAPVAMHCGDWKLARSIILRGIETFGDSTVDLANLAWCEARTGQIRKAQKLIAKALNKEPDNVLAKQVSQRIEDRLSYWDDRWRTDLHHDLLAIVLEPLDLSHAEAFFYQYRDPQIAVMTGLPVLNTLEEVRTWIKEQEVEPDRANYSIMHADYGFVGYINLAISEHASYFCFWTGVDFQGHGIATAAGRLACQYASQLGVNVMLTSAYKDNARSIRALRRIGFVEMDIRALPPDHDRIFYSMISNKEADVNSASELIEYYEREKLPIQFEKNNKCQLTSVLN